MGFFSTLKNIFKGKNEKDKDSYLLGLDKSKKSFASRIRRLALSFTGVNEEFLEELMITLLEADIGYKTATKIISEVENRAMDRKLKKFEEVSDCLIEVMHDMYTSSEDAPFNENLNGPTVILMVGVNGSGKTTTSAKLAHAFKNEGKKVALVAADTFRAGAVEQLARWADRLELPCIKGREKADPSSVLVDGCRYAKNNDVDILICDTAGRLQNKTNLMKELEKMHKVVGREIPSAPHEVWLVLDATTGQNGISQAEIFLQTSKVNGIILSKLDGSAKGGVVIAIRDLLGLPVKYIGLGEQVDDLRKFDIDSYLYSLCEGIYEND